MKYHDILDFWFEQLTPDDWFIKNEALDFKMVEKFIVIHSEAVSGELSQWRNDPLGRLAEIILIDQFSRNIYRDDPKAYLSDGMALILAEEGLRNNIQKELTTTHKQFFYMPFMHSESKKIHEYSVKLFSEPGLEKNLIHELSHKDIIDQFGRYPERNKILGRINSPEEEIYLMKKEQFSKNSIQKEAMSLH